MKLRKRASSGALVRKESTATPLDNQEMFPKTTSVQSHQQMNVVS